MNTILANEDDEKLSKLLHEWKVEVTVPPRFQEQVWRRIERAQAHSRVNLLHAFTHWVESTFMRPALAVSYVAVLLFVGLTTGYLQAKDKSTQAEARWRTAYVQTVDPYQVPRN
jgi:hypothetical protein